MNIKRKMLIIFPAENKEKNLHPLLLGTFALETLFFSVCLKCMRMRIVFKAK